MWGVLCFVVSEVVFLSGFAVGANGCCGSFLGSVFFLGGGRELFVGCVRWEGERIGSLFCVC